MEMQVCCNASHRRTLSLSLAFVLCLTTAVGVPSLGAAESTAAQPAAAEAAAPAVKTPAGGGAATNAAATGMGQLISLTLDDVPLAEVVRLFTRISGANIIAATTNLQGQVTANLQDVAWRPAFESILERQNLQLIEKPPASGIFVIEGRKSGEDPRVSTTIKLNYAKVSDIVVLVNSVLGKEGTVTPFASANSIVVNASVLKTDELRKILEQLDRPRTQVSIETKIVQLSEDTARKIGIDWRSLDAYDITAQPPKVDYNRDVGRGAPAIISERTLQASLTPTEFSAVLHMLDGANGAKTISNPKIMVANEEKAIIKMATDEPNIKVTVVQSTGAGVPAVTTEALDGTTPYFTYGITVEVTPRINTSSNITITIKPELSSKATSTANPTGEKRFPDGNAFPIIDKKSVETIFSLSDGSTAAIGGLITTSDSDTSSKIPLLGDIPFLGSWLFSSKQRSKSQVEVLIFVTVKLIDPMANMDASQLPSESDLYLKKHSADSVLNLAHADVTNAVVDRFMAPVTTNGAAVAP